MLMSHFSGMVSLEHCKLLLFCFGEDRTSALVGLVEVLGKS